MVKCLYILKEYTKQRVFRQNTINYMKVIINIFGRNFILSIDGVNKLDMLGYIQITIC